MPQPPDLSELYQKQKDELEKAFKTATAAYEVFQQRDQQLATLTDVYQAEIVKVLAIAKAVATPISAVASVPVVLAAANEAFAQAPVTDQAIIAAVNSSFAPLGS
ncbi:MAG: hypothetical protein MI743_08870 [Sneathiellales bacterium]|nr:hypothetical protein [Sneathiellales bacterium]